MATIVKYWATLLRREELIRRKPKQEVSRVIILLWSPCWDWIHLFFVGANSPNSVSFVLSLSVTFPIDSKNSGRSQGWRAVSHENESSGLALLLGGLVFLFTPLGSLYLKKIKISLSPLPKVRLICTGPSHAKECLLRESFILSENHSRELYLIWGLSTN